LGSFSTKPTRSKPNGFPTKTFDLGIVVKREPHGDANGGLGSEPACYNKDKSKGRLKSRPFFLLGGRNVSFDLRALKIYIDGSCRKNPGGAGGFAARIEYPFGWDLPDELIDYTGYFETNNNLDAHPDPSLRKGRVGIPSIQNLR